MERWDCSKEGHSKCVARGQEFECVLPGYPERYTIRSKSDLEKCLSAIRAKEKHSEDVGICVRMGVCPVGLFDAFSTEAWTLFNALKDGAPWPWPGGYYAQPAPYARAARVFESELLVIRKEEEARAKSGGGSGKV